MSNDQKPKRTEYEFEPFENIFIKRREQILELVEVVNFSVRSMNGITRLGTQLKYEPERLKKVQDIENLALREAETDLPLVHGSAAVLMWGTLEATFRDFLIRWLVRYPKARTVQELSTVKVKVAEYEGLDLEDRMRYLVGVLEKDLAATLKPGIGRFDCMLKPFGISPQISDEHRKFIAELAAVRNVIAHRAGVADARFLALCPWLGLKEGDHVNVSGQQFKNYVVATSMYAAAIVGSASKLSGKFESAKTPNNSLNVDDPDEPAP